MKFEFDVFADYSQVYIEDSSVTGELEIIWDSKSMESRILVFERAAVLATARNMEVPFRLEVVDVKPRVNCSTWDHVVECSIDVPSGVLHVSGTSDYIGDVRKIEVTPGVHGILCCYGGLGTISEDGLTGQDHYEIIVWRIDKKLDTRVLKQFKS